MRRPGGREDLRSAPSLHFCVSLPALELSLRQRPGPALVSRRHLVEGQAASFAVFRISMQAHRHLRDTRSVHGVAGPPYRWAIRCHRVVDRAAGGLVDGAGSLALGEPLRWGVARCLSVARGIYYMLRSYQTRRTPALGVRAVRWARSVVARAGRLALETPMLGRPPSRGDVFPVPSGWPVPVSALCATRPGMTGTRGGAGPGLLTGAASIACARVAVEEQVLPWSSWCRRPIAGIRPVWITGIALFCCCNRSTLLGACDVVPRTAAAWTLRSASCSRSSSAGSLKRRDREHLLATSAWMIC